MTVSTDICRHTNKYFEAVSAIQIGLRFPIYSCFEFLFIHVFFIDGLLDFRFINSLIKFALDM